jgi:HK97 family phage portal protein
MFKGIKSALGRAKKAAAFSFDTISAGWYARNGYYGIYNALSGGLPAWSGEPVSTDTAMGLSTVWACNKIISESVGFLPVNMMRENGNIKDMAIGKPLYTALKYAPSEEITTQTFTELLTSHLVLQGNGFAKIARRSGTGEALEFYPLQPQMVFPDREKTGQKRLIYVVREEHQADKTYTVERGKPQDILHLRGLGWDGVRGYSMITMARQSLGTAIAQERNVANFYARGGRIPYVLKHPNKFKDDKDYERFAANWEKTYSDPHKPPILEQGLEYEQIGLSAKDAQLIESREFTIPDICLSHPCRRSVACHVFQHRVPGGTVCALHADDAPDAMGAGVVALRSYAGGKASGLFFPARSQCPSPRRLPGAHAGLCDDAAERYRMHQRSPRV